MTPTEPLQSYQPRGIFSTWLGIVLLFALFGLIALVVVRAAPRGSDFEKKRGETRAKKLEDAQKEYFTSLTSYAWVDKAKGTARIPVTDAMKLTVAELAQKKPTAAGPIAPDPAAAPAAPAGPGASPAATAPTTAPPAADGAKPSPGAGGHESEQQPAAGANPPSAPPNTQPGASSTPAASAPPAPAKAQASPSPSPAATAPGTPLPIRGKTP
ncbi:MAG TPA: hypothetical protein VM940_08770 [Chthoniobacterales bacterium]|nr:hypothetical protein [Chthoniobacterales bacterium]